MNRRTFARNLTLGTAALLAPTLPTTGRPHRLKLKKSLKLGMVDGDAPLLEKFRLLKSLGFDGVELDSPNPFSRDEVLAAQAATGLLIPGVVCSEHWRSPLSSPEAAVRARCSEAIATAIADCQAYGGTTVLVVPAVVNATTPYADAYARSQAELRQLLPLAQKTGVKLAIENVWNNFLLSPMEAARYVDELASPQVGWYFDVGNVVRYGWPEQWITTLAHRILKVDVKEYSRRLADQQGVWRGFDAELLEGDCNWPAVMRALAQVGYQGWASAEVPGGGPWRLGRISALMDQINEL
ncbi:MAG: sugar phosphate isomerase/epimerase [Bernardetiaceae bacterium]|jgi:hexulose-6-phosphate isomerase|nr:sugar phosphate isomerase/epimerase [Bernardetiaceae bacterium]